MAIGEMIRKDVNHGELCLTENIIWEVICRELFRKIPYLRELGIECIYLNPIFEGRL